MGKRIEEYIIILYKGKNKFLELELGFSFVWIKNLVLFLLVECFLVSYLNFFYGIVFLFLI